MNEWKRHETCQCNHWKRNACQVKTFDLERFQRWDIVSQSEAMSVISEIEFSSPTFDRNKASVKRNEINQMVYYKNQKDMPSAYVDTSFYKICISSYRCNFWNWHWIRLQNIGTTLDGIIIKDYYFRDTIGLEKNLVVNKIHMSGKHTSATTNAHQ